MLVARSAWYQKVAVLDNLVLAQKFNRPWTDYYWDGRLPGVQAGMGSPEMGNFSPFSGGCQEGYMGKLDSKEM